VTGRPEWNWLVPGRNPANDGNIKNPCHGRQSDQRSRRLGRGVCTVLETGREDDGDAVGVIPILLFDQPKSLLPKNRELF